MASSFSLISRLPFFRIAVEESDVSIVITLLGHLAIDSIIDRPGVGPRTALGGPVSYCSLALKAVSAPFNVVTKVGRDFPADYADFLRQFGDLDLSLMTLTDSPTTRFAIDRSKEPREMRLTAKCEAFDQSDVMRLGTDSFSGDVLLADPIAGEISTELLKEVSRKFETTVIDAQGFVRKFSEDGLVGFQNGLDLSCLDHLDYLKADRLEACAWAGKTDLEDAIAELCKHVRFILLTSGKGPLEIYHHSAKILTATPFEVQAADTTGAGDIMVALFSSGLDLKKSLVDTIKFAVGGATLAVIVSGIGKAILEPKALAGAAAKVAVQEI